MASLVIDGDLELTGAVTLGQWNATAIALAYGGTGATTALGARTNILPSLAGNALKVLKVNAGATDAEWAAESPISPGSPIQKIGLSFVNGSAATYMRSDAAQALDESINPIWTGGHIYDRGAGVLVWRARQTGDAAYRIALLSGGEFRWGDGSTYDVSLSRTGVGALTTDAALTVKTLTASNSAAAITLHDGTSNKFNVDANGYVTLGQWRSTAVALAYGGTGATTAAGARSNLLPGYASQALKVLRVNSGATDVEWATIGIVNSSSSVTQSADTTASTSTWVDVSNLSVTASSSSTSDKFLVIGRVTAVLLDSTYRVAAARLYDATNGNQLDFTRAQYGANDYTDGVERELVCFAVLTSPAGSDMTVKMQLSVPGGSATGAKALASTGRLAIIKLE